MSAYFTPDDPSVDAAQVKKDLLATVRKTPLGRALLQNLQGMGIKIKVTTDIPAVAQDNVRLGGLFDGRVKTLYLDPREDAHKLLHYFAHESRHALQMQAEEGLPVNITILSPVTQFFLTRVREMDADAFAVFFLAQHARQTGERQFDLMRQKEYFQPRGTIDRRDLYDAFFKQWDAGWRQDMAQPMRKAALSLLDSRAMMDGYNETALHMWRNTLWPQISAGADAPKSTFHKAFREALAAGAGKPRDLIVARAKAYSQIMNGAGAPDYLAGVDLNAFAAYVVEGTPAARVTGQMSDKLAQAIDDFNTASARYQKTPKPANTNSRPKSRRPAA